MTNIVNTGNASVDALAEMSISGNVHRKIGIKQFCVKMASHIFSLSVCCRKSCIGIVLWKYGTSIAA